MPFLQASVPEKNRLLFEKLLKGPQRQKYCPELRAFALTLNFYSPKAYSYILDKFNNSLPHPKTLSKWYRSVNGAPGFTEKALTILKIKTEEASNKNYKLLCNLVIDEMSIRKQVEFTGKICTGYITTGANVEGDSVEAKEAFVIMLVCLNGEWKVPIGYFFTNGLNSKEKASIVSKALEFVHFSEIIVTSITFDGAPSNINMAVHLGMDLTSCDNLRTYFPHPVTGDKVSIIFDPSHMLKLISNCLGTYKEIQDDNRETIRWKYFEDLVQFQTTEGLHAGNKLKRRHIEWEREKMKVKLAAQTFSRSVADALIFLRTDLKNINFKESHATEKFCRHFNDLFDIFNSRSRYSCYCFEKRAYRRE